MKAVVYIIVQSVNTGNEEFKNILGTFYLKFPAQDRFNDICVEFDNKEDGKGNFIWSCERPMCDVANFKRNVDGLSMRIELIEREIEI